MHNRKSRSADLKAQEVRDHVRGVVGEILTTHAVPQADKILNDIVIALGRQHLLVPELPEGYPFVEGQLVQGANVFDAGELLVGRYDGTTGVERNVQIRLDNGHAWLKAGTVVAVEDVKPV